MKFHLLAIFSLFLKFILFSQNNFRGTILDSITNEPIVFAKILVFNNSNKLIASFNTDFDGMYVMNNLKTSVDSIQMEIRKVECYQTKEKFSPQLLNDSTFMNYKLLPFSCDSVIENQCKFNSVDCDIYKIEFLNNYKISNKGRKKMKAKKIIYMSPENYPNSCCFKNNYCKTHNYRY